MASFSFSMLHDYYMSSIFDRCMLSSFLEQYTPTDFHRVWVCRYLAQATIPIRAGLRIQIPAGHGASIQTCVVTLGLCVYSALHLNVFHRKCGWWMRWWIRIKWMLIALLAPEFVVCNAWSQRRQAARIAKLLRRRSGQQESESCVTAVYRRF